MIILRVGARYMPGTVSYSALRVKVQAEKVKVRRAKKAASVTECRCKVRSLDIVRKEQIFLIGVLELI
jgi:hypothetical protein